ncbi:hypothetical protein Aph01nite_69850 [Acrocarpospora phusangensis]|uniref:Uncharacterized protein n=1 Tax=Acrocarpospora phusangensis TaxID=1070424 RepID=A0A919QLW9_9ACTN|nr:hypothetical protein [Acrocarpospora phusangensis]GIH28675.1 hypothetical protein Aph01nite_69850 [Acrocarpospora phusangensis]
MSPPTPDDVVARLREGAHTIPDVRFDASAVLATARRALHRRRRRQTLAGLVTASLIALTVTSPVRLPGVGTLTMPGSQQVRTLLGFENATATPPAPPGLDLSELFNLFNTEPPSPETMAREVAGLQTHVLPVLKEIQPTWYEDAPCQILEYPRGTFSDNGTCGGRPGERPFDAVARADLNRILDAVDRSGVPTNELINARYAPDGTVESAGFLRAENGWEWNYAYLYSPNEQPRTWESGLGPVTITPIGTTNWWFEKSPDD